MSKSKIKIEALVAASLDKAWNYYTNPKHITKWNFASDDWQCPSATNELKVGGKYTARMEAKDGSFGFDFEGIYDEVILQKKTAFTMADGRQVITEFHPQSDKVKVVTAFDAETENSEEMQKSGWQAILNNYKKYTENN